MPWSRASRLRVGNDTPALYGAGCMTASVVVGADYGRPYQFRRDACTRCLSVRELFYGNTFWRDR
jgi:hypothetical protein